MGPDRPDMNPHRAEGEVINEPAPAHIPLDQYDTESDDEDLEATELRSIDRNARPRVSRVLSQGKPIEHWYDYVRKTWRHQIRISVPHVDCRDHLGEFNFLRVVWRVVKKCWIATIERHTRTEVLDEYTDMIYVHSK